MTTITIILVLSASFVAFNAPIPVDLVQCDDAQATIDSIAWWLPPSYASFADLMQHEASAPASSAIVLLPCPGLAWDNGSVLVLSH